MRRLRLWEAPVRGGFDGVDEIGKFDRVLDEEHRDVVTNQIPVALFGVEFGRKATHVTGQIEGPFVTRHGRETGECRGFLAHTLENVSGREVGDRLGQLEVPMHPVAARVNDTLWNALVIEVEHLFAKDVIFHQDRAARARFERVLIIRDRTALRSRHRLFAVRGLLAGFTAFAKFFICHDLSPQRPRNMVGRICC